MALDSPNDPLPTWYFSSAFSSTSAFDSFMSALAPQTRPEEHNVMINRFDLVSGPLGCDLDMLQVDSLEVDQTGSGDEGNALNTLASRLHPILTATFLDNAPQLRLDTSSSASVELVVRVMELTKLICGACIRDGNPNDEIFENLSALLGHMTPYFPFGEVVGLGIGEIVNAKTREAMQGLDIAYCELVSLLLSRPQQPEQSSKRHQRLKKREVGLSGESSGKQVREVAAYVVKHLRGEIVSTTGFASTLSPAAYTTLLPTLWALRGEQDVMPTILRHATSVPGGNKAVKRVAVEFVGRIVLLDSDPRCVMPVGLDREIVKEWSLGLPKAVWEFGEKDTRGSEIVLLVLLRMNQRGLFDHATLGALRQRLIPFFMIDHATRGAVAGPWIRLPRDTQRLALDLASNLCQGGGENTTSLANSIERAATDKQLLNYWNSIRPAS
ncbi:hypothetical protein FRC08_012148 [Ceratobasidium sp. 394]|nr:hypothetical protein FRC08_012148 [Ceratobasidium sp. 394]